MSAARVTLALAIAGVDLLQIVLIDKGAPALGGAAIYLMVALLERRGHHAALWIAALMPCIPAAVLLGAAGETLRSRVVDGWMLGVFTLQVALGGLATVDLVRDRCHNQRPPR